VMRIDRRTFLKLMPGAFLDVGMQTRVIPPVSPGRTRPRELGIRIGLMQPGRWNAITDVPGVKVGHCTIIRGSGALKVGEGPVRTGITAIWPHENIGDDYVPFSFHILNGNGEVTGLLENSTYGVLGLPICTTNTYSVGMVYDAMLDHFRSSQSALVPVVGETWDAFLNDEVGRHVHAEHVLAALEGAVSGPVAEGCVGGGTGMISYQFKGGIGTASRRLPGPLAQYTVGVLVQANHGLRELFTIDGVPVGQEITDKRPEPDEASFLNSILTVIATDAPLREDQLNRLAKRTGHGLARTGSVSSNSSGDFALAFSTGNKINRNDFWNGKTFSVQSIEEFDIQPFFQAVAEATEEAVLNALFMATDMIGIDNHKVFALPIDRVLKIMSYYRRLFPQKEKRVAAL
jgi:D-aminopeptidase